MVTGKNPTQDREFLLILNALLVGVMALIIFSLQEMTKSGKQAIQLYTLLALSIITILINCVALYSIIFRLVEFGFSANRVAVIGVGGIGFDVSEYLLHHGDSSTLNLDKWLEEWGIDKNIEARGGIAGVQPIIHPAQRKVFMFKRSKGKFGGNLGKTTGWIHRANLKKQDVQFINEVQYTKIDDQGLHYTKGEQSNILEVDTVIICAGQTPLKELYTALESSGKNIHIIGGADIADELDAKRAIDQGCRLAASL